MTPLAIEEEVLTPPAKERFAALDLQGQKPAGRFAAVCHLDMSINPPVGDGLLPKNPSQLSEENALDGIHPFSISLLHEGFLMFFNWLSRDDSNLQLRHVPA